MAPDNTYDWDVYAVRLLWMVPTAVLTAYVIFCLAFTALSIVPVVLKLFSGEALIIPGQDDWLLLFIYLGVGLFILLATLPVVILFAVPIWLATYRLKNGSWEPSISSSKTASWCIAFVTPLIIAVAAHAFGLLPIVSIAMMLPVIWASAALIVPYFAKLGFGFAK